MNAMTAVNIPIPPNELKAITDLADLAREAQEKIVELETKLALEKAVHLELTTKRLPDAMQSFGLVSFTLDDGTKIEIGPEYHAQIAAARRANAHGYLVENKLDAVIKVTLSIEFGKKELERARDLHKELSALVKDRPVEMNESVHPSTLKALVRERHELGDPLPEDLFGIHIFQRAKITAPSSK